MSEYVYLSMSIYAGAIPQGRPKFREYVLRKNTEKDGSKEESERRRRKRVELSLVLVKCGVALPLQHTIAYSLLSNSADGSIP